jgi:hypothetical protein
MQTMTSSSQRRWFQFSLRTMLIGVMLVSIPLAWVGYSLNWIRQRREMIERGRAFRAWPETVTRDAPSGLWIFGERGSQILASEPTDMEKVKHLFPEADVFKNPYPSEAAPIFRHRGKAHRFPPAQL